MKKIVTFGELMLRLAPEGFNRFFQTERMTAAFGGGEANVAVSLANFGLDAAFVTKLPNNDIGEAAAKQLRYFGVDTSLIVRGGERMGIYFVEKGASQRPSKVIYDRAHSAIAEAANGEFRWDEIFRDAQWFHFTGITPALGASAASLCEEACVKAKELGLTVSCDLNFRKNLWSSEEACAVMGRLMNYVDVCIANEEDAEKVFGIRAPKTDVSGGRLSREGYEEAARQLAERFGCSRVAITLRTSLSASDNRWSAMLYDGTEFFHAKTYDVHIVDRVGGGDSFGAGLIYGLCTGLPSAEALEFAAAASCLKHSIEGDFNRVSVEEARRLMEGDGSGRVQR